MLMLEEGTLITRIKFAVTTSGILLDIRQPQRAVYHSVCQRLTVETEALTVPTGERVATMLREKNTSASITTRHTHTPFGITKA